MDLGFFFNYFFPAANETINKINPGTIKIKDLMSPIHSIIEKTSVSDVLDLFVKRREQMFMVTDDFGTTTGLITLEDAIETLLGVEIVDEHDHVIDMRKLASAKLKQQNLTK